jgi:hypothetical protein
MLLAKILRLSATGTCARCPFVAIVNRQARTTRCWQQNTLFQTTAAAASTPPDPSLPKPPKMTAKEILKSYKAPPTLPGLEHESKNSRKNKLRKHIFFRFLDYLINYEKLVAAIVPKKLVEMSKVFIRGTKRIVLDMRDFAWVYKVLSNTRDWQKAASTLSRRQLELYLNLPDELYRVAPVLVISAFPLMQNVAFPVALMYPKKLLSSHYWDDKVKAEVAEEAAMRRHSYYRPLFRDLHRGLDALKGKPYHQTCKTLFRKLGVEGALPTAEDILELKPVFSVNGVYSLAKVNSLHVRHLMKANGRYNWLWWRHSLREYSNLLREMDKAISRENLEVIGDAELSACCGLRGLSVQGLGRSEMMEYLDKWVRISVQIDESSSSLLLHLPMLLGYNHKTRHWDASSVP